MVQRYYFLTLDANEVFLLSNLIQRIFTPILVTNIKNIITIKMKKHYLNIANSMKRNNKLILSDQFSFVLNKK